MTTSALVLFSGGQDSTTCLYWALTRFDVVHTLSVDYGQKHVAELDAARNIRQLAGIPDERAYTLATDLFTKIGDSALLRGAAPVAGSGGHADKEMPEGLPTSFVPGRNLLFFTMVAAMAVKLGIKDLVSGVCQTDYSGYPDCRRTFVDAFELAATLAMPSSAGPLYVHTPLMYMTKAETVHLAHKLPGAFTALSQSVTCYNGLRPGCGECPACKLRAAGFAEAGFADPAGAA